MNKKQLGIGSLVVVAVLGVFQVATLPPKPFEIPAVPETIPLPQPPALTPYDMYPRLAPKRSQPVTTLKAAVMYCNFLKT